MILLFDLEGPGAPLLSEPVREIGGRREQTERNQVIMFYAKGLSTLPSRSRPTVAAEPARMGGGRTSGVLRERCGGSTGFVGHSRGIRGGEVRAAALRSAPDDEVVGVRVLHGGFS